MKRVDKLIRDHGGRIMRFRDLSRPAQLAAAHYMSIDNDDWDLPPGTLRIDRAELQKKLPKMLPWFREQDGDTMWGYVEIPMDTLLESMMKRRVLRERYGTFERFHEEYKQHVEVPEHTRRAPWPVILERIWDFTLQDGWHRFHRYYDLGMHTVPALYYPTKAEIRRAKKKRKNPLSTSTLCASPEMNPATIKRRMLSLYPE